MDHSHGNPKQITIIKLTNLFNDEAEWGLP
eukprot:COSAG01_NODE_27237_length_690_cov_3.994924_1_plen_29_part_10